MYDRDELRITLAEILSPELRDMLARVEALELEKSRQGGYVEVIGADWLPAIEERIMAATDPMIVEAKLQHAHTMVAVMLHRRISNLEKDDEVVMQNAGVSPLRGGR